ncbi:MAG TPA: IS3 family transposase [Nocardioides sp.]|nr:IS3 family transposase [Nocardioides sp.]
MPKAFPKEFREDVIRVYRDSGSSVAQVAKDFGISPSCLKRWITIDDRNSATPSLAAKAANESEALREANKRIKLLEQENEVLRRAAAYLSQANLPKMTYPLVRELAADGIPVAVTCRVLKIARQPYYRWLANPVTDADLTAAYRANALFDAHRDDPEFGYRFLADEARTAGESMAERTAWRICSDLGWWSVFGKKRGRNGKKPGPPVHDDRVERNFTADAPNTLWLSDITEHWTREGKLYLCAIKDVYSNRIVGYSIDSRMKAKIAVAALDNAVARRNAEGIGVAGCVLHTDRGSQFRSRKLVHQLNRHHMIGSMGRVGAAGDNAAMESFFSLLQKNVLDRRTWNTREELRIAIVTWIERTYHRRRRQAALGRLTPVEYELIMAPTAAQAA